MRQRGRRKGTARPRFVKDKARSKAGDGITLELTWNASCCSRDQFAFKRGSRLYISDRHFLQLSPLAPPPRFSIEETLDSPIPGASPIESLSGASSLA